MVQKRDLVSEIEEIRSRSKRGYYPVIVPFRLLILAQAFKNSPNIDSEFLRYIPIGVVACFEGFFRLAIMTCIDMGSPFVENMTKLSQTRDLKIDLDLLRAIQGRRITLGELISHLLSINNLAQIQATMTALTGKDFLDVVKTVNSRFDEMDGEPPTPIISDPARVFRHVEGMFRLRHIYAHELVDFDRPDRAELGAALQSSVEFLQASAEVIEQLLHPDAPLTQAEMNIRTAADLRDTDQRIDAVIAKLTENLEPDRQRKLQASQKAWKRFQRLHAEFDASAYAGGTIYPTIYGSTAQILADERLRELQRILAEDEELRGPA